jgi:hypothetical protein
MRNIKVFLFLLVALSFVLNGCRTSPTMAPTSTVESVPTTQTPTLPTSTNTAVPILPTLTNAPAPKGRTVEVISAEDNGPGTLRQAMKDANSGDTIEFDPSVFPPDQPKIINLQKSLLLIRQEYLKIDASHAGVILDGSEFTDDINSAFRIYTSNNTIRGFTVRNFSSGAIYISSGQNNLIIDNVIGDCDYGIKLGGSDTSNNVITGNHIGVLKDGVTTIPNISNGITVGEGAHNNQIGPENVIAFNNQFGILFPDSISDGNTITQNSIHDNNLDGIHFGISFIEDNSNVSSPIITAIDLDAGTMAGTTCARCTVEIFSDNNDQGAIYEGQTRADDNGMFAFDNISVFAGPWLTSTATDANGNTSDFSLLSVGLKGLPMLQDGNGQPKIRLVITPFEDLADNRMGHLNPVGPDGDGSCPPVSYRMNEHLYWGTKWQFLGLDMGEWEEQEAWGDGWYSRSEMTEYQDCTISLLVENGVTLLARLNYWDKDLHAERRPDYGNEQEVQLFLDHTRFIVSHYKGLIQYYGILNEPNYYVELEDYINLIREVIPVIREEDPQAKIVVGEIPELDKLISREYLFEILRSDIMPDVDAIAIHPMFGTSPQFEETREYYYSYPSLLQEIKDTATAHGFKGEYMATEMTWGTQNLPTVGSPGEYSYTVAAKYYARGIITTLGMNVIAGFTGIYSGPEKVVSNLFIVQAIRNLSDVMAGATAIDLPIEIQSESTNIKSYSFSLPNNEMMVALWSDGAAVEDDPGVTSSLIIPGYTGFTISGIDVLYSFEQELISSNENGDLVIPDFVIKDYPIFIRLSK